LSRKKAERFNLKGLDASKILDRVTEYVLVLDGSLTIVYSNKAFRNAVMRGGVRSFRETLEEPCLSAIEGAFVPGHKLGSDSGDYHLTVTHRLADGSTQKVHYKLFHLSGAAGMVGGVGRALHVAQKESAPAPAVERRGRRVVHFDETPAGAESLLGEVLTRSRFLDQTEKEVRAASRYRYPVSCLVIDVDNFGKVNAEYGNAAGDYVLERLSRILQSQVRQSDIVGKYGGEEFIILAPHTDRVNARFLAERLRRRVQDTAFDYEGQQVFVTVSIGVATLMQTTGIAGEELIGRAVTALKEAQQRGMNRVVIYG